MFCNCGVSLIKGQLSELFGTLPNAMVKVNNSKKSIKFIKGQEKKKITLLETQI